MLEEHWNASRKQHDSYKTNKALTRPKDGTRLPLGAIIWRPLGGNYTRQFYTLDARPHGCMRREIQQVVSLALCAPQVRARCLVKLSEVRARRQ
jgi:hypothetical protein